MSKGRPPDPSRARRKTGNRPAQGTPKVIKASPVKVKPADPVIVERFPPPDTLPASVRGVWRAVIDDLGGSNHMRETYLPALTAYCEALHVHEQASANLHKFGVLVKGPNGQAVPNPLIKVQKEAAATMLRYAETLGLTPSGRIRLGLMEITGMSILSSLNESLDGRK